MARRRARRPGTQPSSAQRPVGGVNWVNWLAVIGVGVLVLIMIVTMIPVG